MKINLRQLAISVLIPLVLGFVSGFISGGSMEAFQNAQKPVLSPPAVVFPIVWTVLFVLMGISSYIVWQAKADEGLKRIALAVYFLQLVFNFFWSIIFFNFSSYLFAFIWLAILWLMIVFMIFLFYKISKPAAYLQLPYLAWVTFAGYLNFMVYYLNR